MADKTKKPFHKTFWGIIILIAIFPFTLTYYLAKSKLSTRNKIIAIVALWAVILPISWAANAKSERQSVEVKTQYETREQMQDESKKKYTVLTGIERDEYSDAYGELVVPVINLWESPGDDRGSVVGKANHDEEVEIIDQRQSDELMFYKVKTKQNKEGWVSERFITKIEEK